MCCPHLATAQFESGTLLRGDASNSGAISGKNPTTSVRRKLVALFLGIRLSAKTNLPFRQTTLFLSSVKDNLISSRRINFQLRLTTTRSCRQLVGHLTGSFWRLERRKVEFSFGRGRTRALWPPCNRPVIMKYGNDFKVLSKLTGNEAAFKEIILVHICYAQYTSTMLFTIR